MRFDVRVCATSAVLLAVAACGSTSQPTDSGADTGGADSSVDSSVDSRADAMGSDEPIFDEPTGSDSGPDASAGPCPSALPMTGSPCPRAGLVCQYGTDPRENCRPSARCEMGVWVSMAPACMQITPPAMCPATREMAQGQACAPMDAVCAYSGLFCRCTNCRSFPVSGCNGPVQWQCNAPNPDMACPSVQPNLGTACAMEGQRCGYDCESYGPNGGRQCTGGVWVASPNNCPISTRRAKRDIVYSSEAEREQMARDVLRMRLATYEYTDVALAGRRRLGFVYEDETTHRYARDPDISGVDLYGYTSLLLATVQTQQRQIEQLQREVRELRVRRAR